MKICYFNTLFYDIQNKIFLWIFVTWKDCVYVIFTTGRSLDVFFFSRTITIFGPIQIPSSHSSSLQEGPPFHGLLRTQVETNLLARKCLQTIYRQAPLPNQTLVRSLWPTMETYSHRATQACDPLQEEKPTHPLWPRQDPNKARKKMEKDQTTTTTTKRKKRKTQDETKKK